MTITNKIRRGHEHRALKLPSSAAGHWSVKEVAKHFAGDEERYRDVIALNPKLQLPGGTPLNVESVIPDGLRIKVPLPLNEAAEKPAEMQSLIEMMEAHPRGAQELAAAELADHVRWLLHQARAQAGFRQKTLAGLLGVSEGAVSQVLSGDGNLKVSTIAKYARACGYRVKVRLESVDGLLPDIRQSYPRDVPRRREGTWLPASTPPGADHRLSGFTTFKAVAPSRLSVKSLADAKTAPVNLSPLLVDGDEDPTLPGVATDARVTKG